MSPLHGDEMGSPCEWAHPRNRFRNDKRFRPARLSPCQAAGCCPSCLDSRPDPSSGASSASRLRTRSTPGCPGRPHPHSSPGAWRHLRSDVLKCAPQSPIFALRLAATPCPWSSTQLNVPALTYCRLVDTIRVPYIVYSSPVTCSRITLSTGTVLTGPSAPAVTVHGPPKSPFAPRK